MTKTDFKKGDSVRFTKTATAIGKWYRGTIEFFDGESLLIIQNKDGRFSKQIGSGVEKV